MSWVSSFKLAPGLRVSTGSRGIRTSVGAGPFRVSASRRTGRSRAMSSGLAAVRRERIVAEKQQAAAELQQQFAEILTLHRADFPPNSPPVAPPPSPVNAGAIQQQHEQAALAGVSIFKFGARKAAKATAAANAAAAIAAEQARAIAQHEAQQRDLDAAWARLLGNDPDTVLATLEDAFEDNEAPSAAVAVEQGEVSLLVLVPDEAAVPDRTPTTTEAGNLSLKKMTKADRAELYKELVCGHILVTVRETFAVAPGLESALVIALRRTPPDAYGRLHLECLLGVRIARASLDGIRWHDANAADIVHDASTDVIVEAKGAAKALTPIDTDDHPELAALIASLEAEMA
jgi:hypothetical protein